MTRPGEPTVVFGRDNARISLAADDLCRHTIAFGSSGSGKTTRAFNPLLGMMLSDLDAGAFIIAPTPESVLDAIELARRAGRNALLIEPGSAQGLDVLTGQPHVDASHLREIVDISGEAGAYADAAITRIKNAFRILQAAGLQYYNFEHLTEYCFDEKFALSVRMYAGNRLRMLDPDSDAAWTIRDAIAYEDTRFHRFGPDVQAFIQLAVAGILEPLRDARILKTFSRQEGLPVLDSIFSGSVIVLHVPQARYGSMARTLYTLAKLRFFAVLEARRANPDLDQNRPIVFAVDGLRNCISPSDVKALGLLRSAGCMVLATADAVSALRSALPGQQVDAILQNFTQKMFFKTADGDTLDLLERVTRGSAEPLDARALLAMHRNQAICHLTVGDRSIDAALHCEPLILNRADEGRRAAAS